MKNQKQEALHLIRTLPDNVTTADTLRELLFKQQIDAGLEDIARGRTISHESLKRRMGRWRKFAGR